MTTMLESAFARTLVEDTTADPSLIFAVADAKSKSQLADLVMFDIYREVAGLPGPAFFPRTRGLFTAQIERARMLQPVGMGQVTTGPMPETEAEKKKREEEEAAKKATGTDWGKVVANALSTVVKVGAGLYITRKNYELEKDKIRSQQAGASIGYQTNSDAMLRAAAMQKAQMGVGLPGWVIPVGIAALLGVAAIFVVPKLI